MSTRNPTKVTTTRTRTKSYDEYTDGFTGEDKRETAGQATRDDQEVNDRVAKDAKSMAAKRATLPVWWFPLSSLSLSPSVYLS